MGEIGSDVAALPGMSAKQLRGVWRRLRCGEPLAPSSCDLRDQHYPGEHEPLVGEALWDQVQAKLSINAVERRTGEKVANPSLLAGLLYDGEGHRMTPSHAVKNGIRYRYYVSQPLIGKTRQASPAGLRIAAAEIERIVLSGIAN